MLARTARTSTPTRALALAALLALAPACKLLREAVNAPGDIAGALTGGAERDEGLSARITQQVVMRYADGLASRMDQATTAFADLVDTPEARIQALEWRAQVTNAAFSIAAGENANVSLLDMVVLVTLGRM